MKAKDNLALKAIREQGERNRAASAWQAKLNAIIGTIPATARERMARDPQEHFLYFKPAKDGAWGELTIASDAPAGFELADPRSCNHIAYDQMIAFYQPTINRLPICGE